MPIEIILKLKLCSNCVIIALSALSSLQFVFCLNKINKKPHSFNICDHFDPMSCYFSQTYQHLQLATKKCLIWSDQIGQYATRTNNTFNSIENHFKILKWLWISPKKPV